MSQRINLLSISGGKDSTAMLLHAIERGVDFRCCFADTGHEHPDTYQYLDYLREKLGIEIQVAKADFAKRIEAKADYIRANWYGDLTAGRPGKWVPTAKESMVEEPPPEPMDVYSPAEQDGWVWQRAIAPLPDSEASAKVQLALEVLVPTGNPFLDMCVWKGRFPSPKGRFCTDFLKTIPITEQIVMPILQSGKGVRSWQGVRKDESLRRSTYKAHEQIDYGVWVYRPLLDWTADDVFALHRKHGIKPNPLYLKGMGRVGCMPCIMCRKGELAEISRRFPEVIERLKKWEELVSNASKRGCSTFFDVRPFAEDKFDVHYTTEGIEAAARWARTERGGRQFNLFTEFEEIPACSSNYGLCEVDDGVAV